MPNADLTEELRQAVLNAAKAHEPLEIIGGGTKSFLGRTPTGEELNVSGHAGIVSYEPTELVLTARAGTPLTDIESALAGENQMLAFEPPHFGPGATLGGAMACGLSGPRRPYAGAARDFALGTRVINGSGEVLGFGGQVMKNVAGYDISRLMVGAMGTLGVLLEASVKVLPKPRAELTVVHECDAPDAIRKMNEWASMPLPLSAACHHARSLFVRLSGTEAGVEAARKRIGGERLDNTDLWMSFREQTHPCFQVEGPLWRLSVSPTAPVSELGTPCATEWGGAQRWVCSAADPSAIRNAARDAGGHATLFRNADRNQDVYQPLEAGLMTFHRRLKAAFDAQKIFNPGRMYADL